MQTSNTSSEKSKVQYIIPQAQHSFLQAGKMFLPYVPKHNDPVIQEQKEKGYIVIFQDDFVTIKQTKILTQVHKDILDLLILNITDTQEIRRGSKKMHIYTSKVTKYSLLRQLGKNVKNYAWLQNKIDEIMDTTYILLIKGMNDRKFKPIFDVDYDHTESKYIFLLHGTFIQIFYMFSLAVDYHLLIPEIVKLKNNLVKSIIRYCIVNNFVKGKLLDILERAGYTKVRQLSRRSQNMLRATLLEHTEILQKYGIYYCKRTDTIDFERKRLRTIKVFPSQIGDEDFFSALLSLPYL